MDLKQSSMWIPLAMLFMFSLTENLQVIGINYLSVHLNGLKIIPEVLQWCCLNRFVGSGRGSAENSKVSLEIPITLEPGRNTIDLLSLTVGLQVLPHIIEFVLALDTLLPKSQKLMLDEFI